MKNMFCCFAELVGTFILVFIGTGVIAVNYCFGYNCHPVFISLISGTIVGCIIYILGPISGAHINPAVTIGLWVTNKTNFKKSIYYIVSQLVGALCASTLVKCLFGGNIAIEPGVTLPAVSIGRAFSIELILTALLFLVITICNKRKLSYMISAILVGVTIFFCVLLGGPFTGGSMNPARSFGPAIVAGLYDKQWLYFVAPVSGVLVVSYLSKLIMGYTGTRVTSNQNF